MSYFETCRKHVIARADELIGAIRAGKMNRGRFEPLIESYLEAPAFYREYRRPLLAAAVAHMQESLGASVLLPVPASTVRREVGNPDVVEVGGVVVYDAAGVTPMGFGRDVVEARRDAQHVAEQAGFPSEFLAGPAYLIVEG